MERSGAATSRGPEIEPIMTSLAERGIHTILLQFTDIAGHTKGVSIPVGELAGVMTHGCQIDGSSMDSLVRVRERDMLLRPDMTTLAFLPAEAADEPLARVMCDVQTMDGQPFEGDPRWVLRRTLARVAERGYVYTVAPEVEYYLCSLDSSGFPQPLVADTDGYFDLTADTGACLRHQLVTALRAMGIEVASSHHEVSPGQHEIDLPAMEALRAADAVATLKYVARRLVAHRPDLRITFMPKPFTGRSGSGMHLHQILRAQADDANLFGGQTRRAISDLALRFIAGQLEHAAAFVAVTCPLVNSYTRLIGGYEAPATVTWAHENRGALIRVPQVQSTSPGQARIELRYADPASNPYLAFAALVQAGLAGIDAQLTAPEPAEELVYAFADGERAPLGVTLLPLSLGDALGTFSASHLMRETFGEHVFSRYIALKRREWREFQLHVTDWEQQTCWETA
ncbi:MAG: type I glutamate--ammonia ligase [Ktedonobacterales bacterium]